MKKMVFLSKYIEQLKNWTNGVTVFVIASLGSLGSVGTGSCVSGSCGAGCGFKCIAVSVIVFVFACLKCKKKQKPVCKSVKPGCTCPLPPEILQNRNPEEDVH